MLTYWETLIATRSNIAVNDSYAQLWGRKLSNAYTVETYTGILPATLTGTKAGYLESYKIYGNAEQNGTPTPENPIAPSGCGVRVDITGLNEPLCGIGTYTDSLELSTGILTRRIKKLVLTGKENFVKNNTVPSNYLYYGTRNSIIPGSIEKTPLMCDELPVTSEVPVSQIGVSVNNPYNVIYINFGADVMNAQSSGNTVKGFKEYLAAQHAAGTPVTIWYVLAEPEISTVPVPSGLTGTIDGYLIQDGTPAPETPIYPTANGVKQADGTYSIFYGYKLPILSNGVEYPIYLGEVKTTRKIKKLVLTGEEGTWTQSGTANNTFYFRITGYYRQKVNITICSHYTSQVNINGAAEMQDGNVSFYANASQLGELFYVRDSNFSTLADLKSYLASQYAAGTPVTVWYVLAEPETSIVNEPLMKIGDYADTIDSTQATAQIPTAAGETTISWAGEGLAPSEVEFVYKVKG